jgi:hypothetical protein
LHELGPGRSLAAKNPKLARERHPTNNGALRLIEVGPRSSHTLLVALRA